MNRKRLLLVLFMIILYTLVVNINISNQLTFNGFEHDEEEILDEFEIVVNFKTGLTWNLKEEYTIKSVSYLGNTYYVTGNELDLGVDFQPFPNPVYMHDSPNYKFNHMGFRGLDNTHVTGYRFKDGGFSSQGVRIY